jgi:hypothetical protein
MPGWPVILDAIVNPGIVYQSDSQAFFHEYLALVVKQFASQRWNSKVKPKGYPREDMDWIRADATVLDRLLDLLVEVSMLSPGTLRPRQIELWWMWMLIDGELAGQHQATDSTMTKLAYTRDYNRKTTALTRLSGDRNLFTKESTKHFFDAVIRLADQNDEFRRRRLKPFIKARRTMAKLIKSKGYCFDKSGVELRRQTQGRKKADLKSLT